MIICYASWDPKVWPFLRSPRQAPTIPMHLKAFSTIETASVPVMGESVPLPWPSVPHTGGSVALTGLF